MDSTKDLIDELVLKMGMAGDAAARAQALLFFQRAERELCGLRRWWFLADRIDFLFTEGIKDYTCDSDTAEVRALYGLNGTTMTNIVWRTWRHLFEHSISAGAVPMAWSLRPQEPTTQLVQLSIWPVPSVNSTGYMDRFIRPRVLADSAESFSRFPVEWRSLLRFRAFELLAEHEEKPGLAQKYASDKQILLASAIQQDEAHMMGVRP